MIRKKNTYLIILKEFADHSIDGNLKKYRTDSEQVNSTRRPGEKKDSLDGPALQVFGKCTCENRANDGDGNSLRHHTYTKVRNAFTMIVGTSTEGTEIIGACIFGMYRYLSRDVISPPDSSDRVLQLPTFYHYHMEVMEHGKDCGD